jgi:hypothetical protein
VGAGGWYDLRYGVCCITDGYETRGKSRKLGGDMYVGRIMQGSACTGSGEAGGETSKQGEVLWVHKLQIDYTACVR